MSNPDQSKFPSLGHYLLSYQFIPWEYPWNFFFSFLSLEPFSAKHQILMELPPS